MMYGDFNAAVAKTTFGDKKIVVAATPPSYAIYSGGYTNWRFGVSFMEIGRDDDGKLYHSEFGYWKYLDEIGGGNSGYNKYIKTGIFVEGFDVELVVSATMEATNDKPNKAVKYSDKGVRVRLDFWSLYNKNDKVQYKGLGEICYKTWYYQTAPLYGIKNAKDAEWSTKNNLNSTKASPYMVVKVEPIDLDGDGYTNEIAMLTAHVKGIDLDFYRISYSDGKFSISGPLSIGGRQYTYNYPDYFRTWSYNGFNRVPGADIVAGDFDGDNKMELVLINQGDLRASQRKDHHLGGVRFHSLYVYTYKWNHSTGNLDCKRYDAGTYEEASDSYNWGDWRPWGGLKAVRADLNGDGKYEVVFAYLASVQLGDAYKVGPCMNVLRMQNDGMMKPDQTDAGSRFAPGGITNGMWGYHRTLVYVRDYDKKTKTHNRETHLRNPVGLNNICYPLVDRGISIVAAPFYSQTSALPCDAVIVRYTALEEFGYKPLEMYNMQYGGRYMSIFKGDSGKLKEVKVSKSEEGISALVAADFAGEGVTLGNPTHVIKDDDVSYMVVLQAAPYHIDNITSDGTTLTDTPTNFSYHKDAYTAYETKTSSSSGSTTNFNIHDSVETIFAFYQDAAKNIIGGNKAVKAFNGLVKFAAGFEPHAKKVTGGIEKMTNFVDGCIDKVENIKTGFDKEVTTSKSTSYIMTGRKDAIQYASAPQNIWRYPVVTYPEPDWKGYFETPEKYVGKSDFLTFSLYDDVTRTTTEETDLYQHIHENGNLFSYHSSVENIEGYNSDNLLSAKKNVQLGTTVTDEKADFEKVTTNETTESKKVTTGFITDTLSAIGSLFGQTLEDVPESETSPTYTRTDSSNEQIRFHFPNNDGALLLNGYSVEFAAYTLENGAITNGYAVKDLKRTKLPFNRTTSL